MKGIIKIVCCVLLLLQGEVLYVFSQETVSVVTRKIEKEFVTQQKSGLTINAERGIITIKCWAENKVKVTLNLVAKNKNLETAREEVHYMKYTLTQNRNEVILKNYLLLPPKKEYSEISSIIRAKYEIFVPATMSVTIVNKFGSVQIRNLNSELNIDLEYSDLMLNNTTADLDLFINTGDLVCINSDLQAKIETRYSQVSFNDVKGDAHLTMTYGSLNTDLNENLNLEVLASRTHIMLVNRDCNEYDFTISGEYTPLRFDQGCYFKKENFLSTDYRDDYENKVWKINYLPPDVKSKITIRTSFGTINLH